MIRKTKIIATIGPATSSKDMLRKIIQRGVNVCRLNFSHLEHRCSKRDYLKYKGDKPRIEYAYGYFSGFTRT